MYTQTNLPFLETTIFDASDKSQHTHSTIDAPYREFQQLQQYEMTSPKEKNSTSGVSMGTASSADAVHNDILNTSISTSFWPINDMEDDDVSDVSSLSSANMLVSSYETNEGDAACTFHYDPFYDCAHFNIHTED